MKTIRFEKRRTLKQVMNFLKGCEVNGLKFNLDNKEFNEVILV